MEVRDYDLFIDLDFERLKFTGRVLIALTAEQDVVLNSVGLEILRVSSGQRDFRFSMRREELVVETGAFDQVLEVDFAGSVTDLLAGIYRAPYDHTHIVTTHFCAAQARRMFPCVDRPDIKAAFRLSVRIDKNLDAVSNMPVERVATEAEKKIVTFKKTPRMSTYLLYLGVGKFQERTEKVGKTDIILATTPGKAEFGKFAQDEAQKAIQYFESYFAIPFALPKVHLVAVPEFAAGAMENWGAITFREVLLLVEANTSSKAVMRVSDTVTHELAHQWFGDLVTMKWWDDIWLNESFATFMSYKAVDSFHPKWRVWENTFNGLPKVVTLAEAMRRDSLRETHAIQIPINSPDEIEQIFDAVTYGKGCHILRMIEAYIGEKAFRDGVRRYLSTYAYSNTTGENFWAALETASGKQVHKIMSQWVRQPGYPVVTASLSDDVLRLRQERFLISGNSSISVWPIPVTIEMNGERQSILMEKAEQTVEAKGLQSLKINPDRTGFYSVRYVGLEEYVWRSKLTQFDKWGLVFDAFSFLLAGKITFKEYVETIEGFKNESDTLPAQEVSDQIATLFAIVPHKVAGISKELHKSFLNMLRDRTDENSSILHGLVASRLALADEEYASKLGDSFRDYGRVSPDMRRAVAIAYARSSNDLEALLRTYRVSFSDEDRVNLLQASAAFTDDRTLRKALDFTLSGEVKKQDILSSFFAATWNPQAKDIAWTWFQENVRKLQTTYAGTGTLSDTALYALPILGVDRVDEVESFFEQHKMPEAEVGIKAGLEKLRAYDRLARTIMHE